MQRVRILATGGTIAGEGASETSAQYRSAKIGIGPLIAAVPGVRSLAIVHGEEFSQTGSQDISDVLWCSLASRINALFNAGEADGIVVTHGTDTAEETGYFLHLCIDSRNPVVLTGAMRPASALSADGPLNLYNAVAVAADREARGRGVILVINDDVHSARDVTKGNTTDVHAFVSPGPGLLGSASFGKVRYFRTPSRLHTADSQFLIDSTVRLPRVDILYAYVGMPPDLVRASVSNGARGIVVAGVGNGNMPQLVARALAEVAASGIIVVRSTRVGSGEVTRGIEVDDDALGFVASDQLSPPKSRVLLQLCLAHEMDRTAIQDAFYRY
jgi:L-asparaginase